MATGYDIRYNLLNDARNMLFTEWHQKCEVTRRNYDLKQSVIDIEMPAAPSAAQIKALAEDLYEFVQRK